MNSDCSKWRLIVQKITSRWRLIVQKITSRWRLIVKKITSRWRLNNNVEDLIFFCLEKC